MLKRILSRFPKGVSASLSIGLRLFRAGVTKHTHTHSHRERPKATMLCLKGFIASRFDQATSVSMSVRLKFFCEICEMFASVLVVGVWVQGRLGTHVVLSILLVPIHPSLIEVWILESDTAARWRGPRFGPDLRLLSLCHFSECSPGSSGFL